MTIKHTLCSRGQKPKIISQEVFFVACCCLLLSGCNSLFSDGVVNDLGLPVRTDRPYDAFYKCDECGSTVGGQFYSHSIFLKPSYRLEDYHRHNWIEISKREYAEKTGIVESMKNNPRPVGLRWGPSGIEFGRGERYDYWLDVVDP